MDGIAEHWFEKLNEKLDRIATALEGTNGLRAELSLLQESFRKRNQMAIGETEDLMLLEERVARLESRLKPEGD